MSTLNILPQFPQDTVLQDTLWVSGNDLFALGHYPGNPIYPGVLLLDHLLRLATQLASHTLEQDALATDVERIQFVAAVRPGDVVRLSASVKTTEATSIIVVATASVRDAIHAKATIRCRASSAACTPAPSLDCPEPRQALSHSEIARVLPHRFPFLLLDRVHSYTRGQSIRASKVIHRDLPLLGRHPPDRYPNGLAIESLGQAGIALCLLSQDNDTAPDILLGAISKVELLHPIPFNTVLTLDARIERMLPNAMVLSGEVLIANEPVIRVGNLAAMIGRRDVPQPNP